MNNCLLITGAAGFIGSAVVRQALYQDFDVIALDALTYAGRRESLQDVRSLPKFTLIHGDIRDRDLLESLLLERRPDGIIHLGAETHVDRSIDRPYDFIASNVAGTTILLEAVRSYLDKTGETDFRFHHVSTDEVFGDLGDTDPPFTEESPYRPSSPYAASKAACDHIVRAWGRTYGLPYLISYSANNYGPRQFPEKLVPSVILKALAGNPIGIYGDGKQRRDWIHVQDHAAALLDLFSHRDTDFRSWIVGAGEEVDNLALAYMICEILDELAPERRKEGLNSFSDLITFVADRPGHDRRYANDASRLRKEIGWQPVYSLSRGLRSTVLWYLENDHWWRSILSEPGFSDPALFA